MCVRPKTPYRLHSGVPSQSDTNSKQRTCLKPVVSGMKLKVRGRVVEEGVEGRVEAGASQEVNWQIPLSLLQKGTRVCPRASRRPVVCLEPTLDYSNHSLEMLR